MLVLRITAFVVCFHSYVVLSQYYPERRPTYRPPTYTPPTYRPPTYPPLGGCDPPTKNGYTSYAPERSSYAIGSRIIYSCTNGYVTGRTTRTCAGNLRWTGSAVRICGCFRPKNPEYGSVFSFPYNQQRFTPGEYVTFRCNPPYKLSGSSRVQCQQNGQWNNLPKCELAQTNCKKQQPPANGYYVQHDAKSDWRPGDTATYACDDNYCMTGQASLTCQQNSNWDYPMPTCRACCSRPEAPEYGSVVSTPRQKQYFDLGDFVIFRCRPGYTLSSQGLVGCQETGWANKPTCIKDVTCPQREDPVNGYRVKNEDASWVSGSKTTYGCGEHYCLYGHEVTTCQDDGSWDHSVPTCRVCCHRPNPPPHGSIHSVPIDRETFYLDDWIIYRCDEGYWLDGESKVGCLEGGWTPHPTCRRITCPHRDQPEYGYYVNHEDGKGWYPGDTAQYGCSNGYCMHGQADSNCLDDGTWQHDPPQCQACCARPNPPDYGSLNSKPEDKQTFYGGDWIIYRCDHGYRLVGESRVECGHGGWGVAPWCQRIKCPHRNPPEYGYYNEQKQHDSWYPDDVASYGCDNHYCMSGDHQSKCQYDGTWNGGVPSCRVCCQRPADPPEYGSFASDPENKQVFYKDEYITYSCDHGYRLVGYSRRTCTKTGWTPAPTCRRIKCPHRDAPEYGYYSNNEDKKDWYPEDSASYKCNNHYCMYGDNDSKCQYDGTWNQDVPSCRVCCKRPNPPPYSSIESDPEDKQTFYRNEYITYSCEYGYEMVGSSRRRCLKGGWTTEPTCRRISCPHRSAPEYGYYSDNSDKKDWYPEDSASYGCEQHYCMSGQASSSCQYDGSWQYPIPICHACCKRPQAPQYGSVHSTPTNKQTFYVGEWVSYSCDHGYKIVGNPRAQCEKGGWNSSPTCARVTCPHRNPPEYGNYANGNDDEKDWYPEDTAEYTCQNFYCHVMPVRNVSTMEHGTTANLNVTRAVLDQPIQIRVLWFPFHLTNKLFISMML
ncbi:complement receptor type 2-like [Clavelina lepadiformis]|uniref:complement receptor type 2-like n=1 Tax=Clavelina lepadiformis TaxID=159417 RepID=UPI004042C960